MGSYPFVHCISKLAESLDLFFVGGRVVTI